MLKANTLCSWLMLAIFSEESLSITPEYLVVMKVVLGLTKTVFTDIQRRKSVIMVNLLLKVWFILEYHLHEVLVLMKLSN